MKQRINITLDNTAIEKVDKLSNEYHISRSALISFLICEHYDCYNMANNLEIAIAKVRDSKKQKTFSKIL